MGDAFTVADAYLFTVLNWAKLLRMDLTPWPVIMEYIEQIKNRPATINAIQAERSAK